jgi:hypothetical protein
MTAIWHKNGYVTIPGTQAHIDASMERDSSHCMTARPGINRRLCFLSEDTSR